VEKPLGGLLGIILAYAVSLSLGGLIIAPGTVIVATLILTGVALFSGMIPALRASRLDPIEALRYE